MKLHFQKLDGAGNDFVGLDWRGKNVPEGPTLEKLTRALCDRHHGVGADGLLLIADDPARDFRLIYLNRDGSRAEMCGNGARCAALFARIIHAAPDEMTFETDAGSFSAEVIDGAVRVAFPDIEALPPLEVELLGPAKSFPSVLSLNSGVPHALIFCEDLDIVDVETMGREVRFDPAFKPHGTNANFCEASDGVLRIRTYERGVEGETEACGTGAVAAACAHGWRSGATGPVELTVVPTGGIPLTVAYNATGSRFTEVLLTGPARVAFEGTIEIEQ